MNTDSPHRETPGAALAPQLSVRWLPPHKVVIHNNDHTSFDEVVGAIARAVPGCGRIKAMRHAMTAHLTGAAVVHRADWDEAEACAGVIRGVGVHVTVEPDA